MDKILASRTSFHHFYVLILGVFAIVALVLATIGIYGVIAYTVNERTHEIGIRIALGAQAQQVLGMVVKQGLILSLIGVLIGLAASLGATRLLSSFLFAVTAHDPMTFMLVSLLLLCVTAEPPISPRAGRRIRPPSGLEA